MHIADATVKAHGLSVSLWNMSLHDSSMKMFFSAFVQYVCSDGGAGYSYIECLGQEGRSYCLDLYCATYLALQTSYCQCWKLYPARAILVRFTCECRLIIVLLTLTDVTEDAEYYNLPINGVIMPLVWFLVLSFVQDIMQICFAKPELLHCKAPCVPGCTGGKSLLLLRHRDSNCSFHMKIATFNLWRRHHHVGLSES